MKNSFGKVFLFCVFVCLFVFFKFWPKLKWRKIKIGYLADILKWYNTLMLFFFLFCFCLFVCLFWVFLLLGFFLFCFLFCFVFCFVFVFVFVFVLFWFVCLFVCLFVFLITIFIVHTYMVQISSQKSAGKVFFSIWFGHQQEWKYLGQSESTLVT